jgi:hypothetical protein
MKKQNYLLRILFASLFAFTIVFTSCNDDDDNNPTPETTGLLKASDQVISQNKIVVESTNIDQKGWVVVHKDNGNNAPSVPDIISVPLQVQSGLSKDITVQLKDDVALANGEKVWIMLHNDDGILGSYEFNGSNGKDEPIVKDGQPVMQAIILHAPEIGVKDQGVINNSVVIDSVVAAVDGWLVIHNDDGSGNITLPGIIGKTMVNAGVNKNVVVELNPNFTFTNGQKLFPMLHIDDNIKGEYEFDGSNGKDAPEVFGNADFPGNVIFTSFNVVVPTGSLTVENQVISQNRILVPAVSMSQKGWIVVHKDNGLGGPEVPEIISAPIQVEPGNSSNIMVKLKDDIDFNDGDDVWVMLHTDNGVIGEYEFDGNNGFDAPVFADGTVVMKKIKINAASITAIDQAVILNSVTIPAVVAATDGWLVIHNDDGSGNITLPGIIGKTPVSKGTNLNVVVQLQQGVTITSGQKLFPMLHIDDNIVGTYEFDGTNGHDAPEIFGNDEYPQNVIYTSFDVL